jgi:tripartite-type tricarboxylate transporter receptor subunit TctC
MNDGMQQQTQRIDKNMALLALDQFAGIEAVRIDADGTPKGIIAQIAEANHVALADKTYQQSLIDAAVEPLPDWTADRFNEFMSEEVARWTPLVRKLGIRLD